jgi:hypothetical protein
MIEDFSHIPQEEASQPNPKPDLVDDIDAAQETEQVEEQEVRLDNRQLEDKIMAEIGLGQNYRWYNGSGSCEYIRKEAVAQLKQKLENYREEGYKIAPTSELLVGTLQRIANSFESSRYSLTNTWQALSYVIAEHLHTANLSPDEQERAFQSLNDYLVQNYQVAVQQKQEEERFAREVKNRAAEKLAGEVDMEGLTYQEKQLVKDYAKAHVGNPETYRRRSEEMVDFIRNPQDYEATDFAWQLAWCDFVLRPAGDHRWPREVDVKDIDKDKLRNVRVEVSYSYSSTLGGNAAVKQLIAEVQNPDTGEWRERNSGGVAFSLSDWVKKR